MFYKNIVHSKGFIMMNMGKYLFVIKKKCDFQCLEWYWHASLQIYLKLNLTYIIKIVQEPHLNRQRQLAIQNMNIFLTNNIKNRYQLITIEVQIS